jgi:hypothetical protein
LIIFKWSILNNLGDEPGIMWTDGSKVAYSNFDKNDNNRRQGCVYMVLNTLQWRVGSCMDKHFYICKGPAGNIIIQISVSLITSLSHGKECNQRKEYDKLERFFVPKTYVPKTR